METDERLIEKTIDLIKEAHRGQVDKGGQPYYRHPLRVMVRLGAEATAAEKIAALLHDVVEDTGLELEGLRETGYSEEVIEIVRLVSEREPLSRPDLPAAHRGPGQPVQRLCNESEAGRRGR